MNKLLTVGELLGSEELPFDHHVLLPTEVSWELQTLCAIVESDELAEPEEHPLAVENHLGCSIGTNEVMDIVANAKQQKSQAKLEELLDALEYYCDNDAFIEFDQSR